MPETFLLVDGENIDATLGNSVLGGRRPTREERPRWERVLTDARELWSQPARGLFFLNATSSVPTPFVQALTALEYRPVLLSGGPDVKVVDVGIQRTLDALLQRGHGDVVLASHDADFAEQLTPLLDAGRRVAITAFRELLSSGLAELLDRGAEFRDLEDDVGAFTARLPRLRVVDVADFDPWPLLEA